MNLSTIVRAVALAGAFILGGVLLNQILVGAILAVFACVLMMVLNLWHNNKFKAWSSHPLVSPQTTLESITQRLREFTLR